MPETLCFPVELVEQRLVETLADTVRPRAPRLDARVIDPRPKDEAFFLSSRGVRLSATGLQSNFAKARKLAGFDNGKPLRPHDLRHRFAVTRLKLWPIFDTCVLLLEVKLLILLGVAGVLSKYVVPRRLTFVP